MDANPAVELLKAWSSLIAAISWPLVIVFALLFFGRPLRVFLQNGRLPPGSAQIAPCCGWMTVRRVVEILERGG